MNKRAKEKQLLEEAYTSIYSEAEEKKGVTIGGHVHEVGSNDPLGSGTIRKIITYPNGYMIFASDGELYSRMVDLEGQAVGEGYLKNEDGESYSKEEAAEDEVYDRIDGLIDTEDKERLVYLFKLAIADKKMLDVVTSIHDDLKEEGFDVDDINDYIAETFKFTLGG